METPLSDRRVLPRQEVPAATMPVLEPLYHCEDELRTHFAVPVPPLELSR